MAKSLSYDDLMKRGASPKWWEPKIDRAVTPILSFLYMHMENHIEHHIYPNIPFHALARFRRVIDAQMPPACTSLWDAYREIVPALMKQRHDTSHFIRRKVPGSRGRS